MGWTVFACFGCTKKRKRPKIQIVKRMQGYEALQSDIHKKQHATESHSILREKPTDEKKARIRKKVRFNLDVVTYEPLSSQEGYHDSSWEERGDEQAAAGICLISTDPNYRYNNCYDGEDEYDEDEDDDECQFSDDDNEDEDDVHNQDSIGGYTADDLQNIYYEEITEDLDNCSSKPLISSAANARFRSHYIVPVLNPIENLSQWKAIKTRKC